MYKSMMTNLSPNGKLQPHQQSASKPYEYSSIPDLVKSYEEKMTSYIYEVPHIPPTIFELKQLHHTVKSNLLQSYKLYLSTQAGQTEQSIQTLAKLLSIQLDKLFASLVAESMKEYRMCQTGFIVGWKCSVNKPANNSPFKKGTIDDRF